MDAMAAILEGDWSCLSGMYTTDQEADFMSELFSNCPLGDDETRIPSFFWPANVDMTTMADASYCSSDSYSPGSNILFSSSSQESYYLSDSHPAFAANTTSPTCMDDGTNPSSFLVEADDSFNNVGRIEQLAVTYKNLEPQMETKIPKPEPIVTQKNSKKRTPSSGDVQKTKRNTRSKKNQNSIADNDKEGNAGLNRQSSASCSSEDDSNASQELKGEEAELNLTGKTRASRGAATDPQSLYARKRRERINERLRILQNLVPNGTKVDISTMLEEAVQYVKFLQLQIKLLSSDDHWMYAPIAYNGMDIGLDLSPRRS